MDFYRCGQEDQETGYLGVVRVEISDEKMSFALLHRNPWLVCLKPCEPCLKALEEHCRGAEQASTFCCEGRGCCVNLVIGVPCVMPILIAYRHNIS